MYSRGADSRAAPGRHTIHTAPTPASGSTSADTTVSTRPGNHHGCGSPPPSTRRTTPGNRRTTSPD